MSANQAVYDARSRRIVDVVALRQPDRMPIVQYARFSLAKHGAISHGDLMYDYAKTKAISEHTVLEFDPDADAPPPRQAAVRRQTSRLRKYTG